jgi:hypothetical integral membrane protein (TIGR02206 family)
MPPPFERWGPGHLGAIALTIAVPLLLSLWTRRDPSGRAGRWSSAFLVAILVSQALMLLFWLRRDRAERWFDMMPLQLCDWALWVCVVACVARRQLAYEFAYFWGMAGTLQGMITPDLEFGFPSVHFLAFFVGHGGIIGTVIFLTAGLRFRPHWSSVARAYAGLLGYAAIAGGFNAVFGTNYGFLSAKPSVASLLDLLGPWPWYIASLALLGLVNFAVLYVPWAVVDWRRGIRP